MLALQKLVGAAPDSGLITYAQLKEAGATAMVVKRAVKRGDLVRLAHGIYQLPVNVDYMDDEMYMAQLRYQHMIYSHDTALYLHELNDRVPHAYSVTVPTGYNTKRLIADGFKVFSLSHKLQEQDVVKAKTMYSNDVKVYNLERTICDCLRSRNKLQSEVVIAGLKGYVKREDRNLNALMIIAEKLKVSALLKTYLEVLL